jgi:hypothetical protein
VKTIVTIVGFLLTFAGWAGAQAPASQLRVSTIPEGAMVSCDGTLYDVSPITIPALGAGPHLVVLKKPGFLDARCTVNLSANQKAAVELKLEPVQGLVLVRSTPDGAEIKLDDADRGKTPLLLTDLPVGKYRLVATAPGYVPKSVEVSVENRTPQLLTLDLASDSAKLVVRSTPVGAVVVVNGLTKGVTPCEVDRLSSGENTVSVTLDGYAPFVQKVRLQAGDEQKIDAALNPLPVSLSILSTPAGARVFVNDALSGQTPLVLDAIVPGTYTVRVEDQGFETESRKIELKKQDRRVEEFQLVKLVGTLEVLTDQAGAKIMVDGRDTGTMPAGGEKPAEAVRIELPVGEHKVVLSKKGFSTIERTVDIKRGETLGLREAMKRNFVPDTTIRLLSNEVIVGCLSRKFPNGDIELETKAGIFRTLKVQDILAIEPITAEEKK